LILRQSTAVAISGRALLIEGPPGSGKTSLALTLIDRGAQLVGDDGIALDPRLGGVWANPAPRTAGLIEVRNVGIATLPAVSAPISLVLAIDPAAPRFVERPADYDIAGVAVPMLFFDARGPAAAMRAEMALALHGLSRPLTA
jgi:HPr kinase/phosphorylase